MSPRKSSTSSGKPPVVRPRYLALEVTGGQPLPPRLLESLLLERLGPTGTPGRVRLIRAEGNRALIEVPHLAVGLARLRWTGSWTTARGAPVTAATRRTFGTLVKGKQWLHAPPVPTHRPARGV